MSGLVGGGKTKSNLIGGGFLGEPNQKWQNVGGSRSSNTTYTNTTGSPIMVMCSANLAHGHINVVVGSAATVYNQRYTDWTIAPAFIVPNGTTYKVQASDGTVDTWNELR
tara:strand:- start:1315 stop:1644 length:330 start_codon:yes stop_codon:yes gene_type:complete